MTNSPLLKQKYLQVEPDSVTPFGLLYDTNHTVTVILDTQLFSHALIGFHPLKNNAIGAATDHVEWIFQTSNTGEYAFVLLVKNIF